MKITSPRRHLVADDEDAVLCLHDQTSIGDVHFDVEEDLKVKPAP